MPPAVPRRLATLVVAAAASRGGVARMFNVQQRVAKRPV
jgi:hypothetical protein